MGVCGGCCSTGEEENKKMDPGSMNGPVANRGCTDILCMPILIAAQIVFIIVTLIGVQDGNPQKLYKPRDFRGNYCGIKDQWNNGGDKTAGPVMSYTMNVTSTVDEYMKQLVCSTAAKRALVDGDPSNSIARLLTTQASIDKYMCDCCLSPCKKCEGSLDKGGDIKTGSGVLAFASQLTALTNPAMGSSLFDPSGPNGAKFSATAFWQEATKYFNMVCLPSCGTDAESIKNDTEVRNYTYEPMRDDALYTPWKLLLTANDNAVTTPLKSVIASAFVFKSFPESMCPYSPDLCVPFPGLKFGELAQGADYCTFEMASKVVDMLGESASNILAGAGFDSVASASSESFGKWAGDFQASVDTFIIVSVLSFVIGIIFLVVLRFTIGLCVLLALICTVVAFALGGALLFVISGQCQGASILATGKQVAVSVGTLAAHTAYNAVKGLEAPNEKCSASMNCTDYRGGQRWTKFGKTCMKWDEQEVMPRYNSTNFPDANLMSSLCRNPYLPGDVNAAATIWCITSDVNFPWQECLPIGVIQPACTRGYAIGGQNMRYALYYMSWVVWGLGIVWILLLLCFKSRIMLAIALNKVAAIFLAGHPHILLLPIIQGFLGILWCLAWMFSASFLLSQVPAGYTPTAAYSSYAEAYGTGGNCAFWEHGTQCTEGTPGKCTDKWPTGSVWKDNNAGCIVEMLSGVEVVSCWRCAPPRYVFDIRIAISFFVFLWNNAFNIALGQIIVAMCVSTWFFLSKEEKGKAIICQSIRTVFRYHIGSVAFGSFIVAMVQFIRYMMKYFEKQAAAQKNRIMVLLLKVVQCCLWCFERCIKFLNKNAYIQIALHGTNFCVSARKAFFLIMRNVLRFGTVAALSNIIHVIGFVCITICTVVVGYLIMRAMHPDISPFIPCFCIAFMAWNVASLFMGVFGLAVDTSLQCFIACEEMQLSGDFVPASLGSFIKNEGAKVKEIHDAHSPTAA